MTSRDHLVGRYSALAFRNSERGHQKHKPQLALRQRRVLSDLRVVPAYVLGLNLGDAVVIRNNGGRVTQTVIDEIATIAFMVARSGQVAQASFNLVLMQHTQCGGACFADPEFQKAL